MLIVVSHSAILKDEAAIINGLFDAGLDLFHLRKPEADWKELERLMSDVNPSYYNRIAFHSHHDYAQSIGITRLHFPEKVRESISADIIDDFKEKGYHLTTSFHPGATQNSKLKTQNFFDYAFYGPVFDSISKKDYRSAIKEDDPFISTSKTKLIALGGINGSNSLKALQIGFHGIALCGAIWNNTEPINTFNRIKEQCTLAAQ